MALKVFRISRKASFASRLISSALIGAAILFVAMVGVTFSKPNQASVVTLESAAAPVAETAKIVPADPLGSPTPWVLLTGDGSN